MLRWLSSLRQTLTGTIRANRRREQRRPFTTPIEIRVGSGVTYRGFSRDLSRLGMGAVVSAYLEIGQEVWVSYDHPTDGTVSARAVVRRGTVRQRFGYRYGFAFQVAVPAALESDSVVNE